MIYKYMMFTCSCVLLVGCLKTRADLRGESEDSTPQRTTVAHQKAHSSASTVARFEEYDEQVRALNGRIETLENQIHQLNSQLQSKDKEKQSLEQRFQVYEDALKKLETQIQTLQQAHEAMAAATATADKPTTPAPGGSKKTPYDEGEDLLGAKRWKESIVAYQKYRDSYPKGKAYADATYKIGVAFQELGMKDEAKAFFEEVTAKFPQSKEAKKAAFRLKSLK